MSIGRISQNMQTRMLKSNMQTNLSNLLTSQEQLSSGVKLSKISDDPVAGTQLNRMESTLEIQNQYLSNIKSATASNNMTDNTLSSVYSLLLEVQSEASSSISGSATASDRESSATMVDSALDELITLGNTQYLDSYIFGGTKNTTAPYSWASNSLKFSGNLSNMTVQTSSNESAMLSALASDVFGTGSGIVEGTSDLSPTASSSTLLSDLNGALGKGIRLGTISISGSTIGTYNVDLSGCSNLGDVISTVNNALPDSVNLNLDANGQNLALNSTNAGETLAVTESGTGMAAHDLGLYTTTPTAGTITGEDLGTRITLETSVNQLNGGAGLDLTSGMVVTNGATTETLDFSSAKTVQDILSTINNSDLNITAQINEDGNGINIINQLAGTALTIGENGGTTAEDLGIRTMYGGTKLSDLNGGTGVTELDGADFKITASDGSSVEVDIAGAKTVQDVIDMINTQAGTAGVNVKASLTTQGNGIVLTDSTGGTSNFKVERTANLSNAAAQLGILNADGVSAGSQIVGTDVNPVKEQSIFTYMMDLEDGLKSNDTQAIEAAAEKIEAYMDQLNICRGQVGYQGSSLKSQQTRMEDAITTTTTLISNLKDVDYVDSISQYQSLQTTLSASLKTGSNILQMSLLDYLS